MPNKEWTKKDFKRAQRMKDVMPDVVEAFKRGPGRPKTENPKQQVTLRLDPAILSHFKEDGKGWQSRINTVLKEYVAEHQ